MQLTCSSYKVTSFLDFQPFLHGFPSVSNYLDNLWTDVNNPSYFQHLFIPFAHVLIDPTNNDSHKEDFLKSPACHHCPYSPLLLFLNYHKLHLMNMFYHLYWFQNYKWKNHQQLYLFHTVHLLWNHCHQLQLIIKPNCYHWKCLIVLPLT